MKVVVTGAAGLLGRYAVSRLRASGHQVLGLTRGGVGGHTATDYSVESLAVLLRGADAVVDLAYSRPVTSHHADVPRTIVVGTNVLEAAARAWVRTVVQASSVEVYDPDATRPFREDSPTMPRSPYGMVKLTVERWAQLDAYLEIRTVSLRLSSLIGSGDCAGWPVAAYLRDAARDRPPHEPPGTVHDLLHAADAARAIELALLTESLLAAVGAAVGLGTGTTVEEATAQAQQEPTAIGWAGVVGLVVVLFVSYFAGGYVAGRMARFDGVRQGLGV